MGPHGNRSRIQRVLILKIGAIGDVAMSLALLSELKDAEVDWVCGQIPAPLVAATQRVRKLILVDEKKLFKGTFFQKICEVIKVWKQLIFHSYDLILLCHPDSRFRLLSLPIRCKEQRIFTPPSGMFHPKAYLRLLKKTDVEFPSLHCPLLEKLEPWISPSPILIAPGGARNVLRADLLRRWPIEHYATLIRALTEKGERVVLIGAESDRDLLPALQGVAFESLIGETSLLELIALLQKSRLLITHDSGPLHLARLAKCPIVALFGPTDPKVFAHDYQHVLWKGEQLRCSPCYNGKTFADCENPLCMKKITPQEVLRRVERALSTEETSIPCMQGLELQVDSNPS